MREVKSVLASKVYAFKAEFYDVDSMCVMWHGNYVKYTESARCSFLDAVGFNYNDMQKSGFAMPVIKMDFKFIAPILFNERFSIQVDLLEFENLLRFQYIFYDTHNHKKTLAQTSQVAFSMRDREILYVIPSVFKEKIADFIKQERV